MSCLSAWSLHPCARTVECRARSVLYEQTSIVQGCWKGKTRVGASDIWYHIRASIRHPFGTKRHVNTIISGYGEQRVCFDSFAKAVLNCPKAHVNAMLRCGSVLKTSIRPLRYKLSCATGHGAVA